LSQSCSDDIEKLCILVTEVVPSPVAAQASLTAFVTAIGVEVKAVNTKDGDDENEITMAMQASLATYQAESTAHADDDMDDMLFEEEQEQLVQAQEKDKKIRSEVEIIWNAIDWNLATWKENFPASRDADKQWPLDFSKQEQKVLRAAAKKYVEANGYLADPKNRPRRQITSTLVLRNV
jgi:putative alpha-1,2-mannosidase